MPFERRRFVGVLSHLGGFMTALQGRSGSLFLAIVRIAERVSSKTEEARRPGVAVSFASQQSTGRRQSFHSHRISR
jgi:hypothetical protein